MPLGRWNLALIARPLRTRRCWACRQRYPRKLPNCPRCKARPGDRGGSAASGFIPSRQRY